MAAHINFNQDAQTTLKGDDYFSLLAWQEFCFNNLKNLLLTQFNKKTADQLKENNDLLNFMSDIMVLMEKFQIQINKEYFRNVAIEHNTILENQRLEGQRKMDELNQLFDALDQKSAEQKMLEQYEHEKQQLDKHINKLESLLARSDERIDLIKSHINVVDTNIQNRFQAITAHAIKDQHSRQFELGNKNFQISVIDIEKAFKAEFREVLANGSLKEEDIERKAKSAYMKAILGQYAAAGHEVTPDIMTNIGVHAEVYKNDYMEKFRGHSEHKELRQDFARKTRLEGHLIKEVATREEIQQNLTEAKQQKANLEIAYNARNNGNNLQEQDNSRKAFSETVDAIRDFNDTTAYAIETNENMFDEIDLDEMDSLDFSDALANDNNDNAADNDADNPVDFPDNGNNNDNDDFQPSPDAGGGIDVQPEIEAQANVAPPGGAPFPIEDVPAPAIPESKSKSSAGAIFAKLNAKPAGISDVSEALDAIQNIGQKEAKENARAYSVAEAKGQDNNPDDNRPIGPRR